MSNEDASDGTEGWPWVCTRRSIAACEKCSLQDSCEDVRSLTNVELYGYVDK